MADGFVRRLTAELGDDALAHALGERVDAGTQAALEASSDDLALAIHAPTAPLEDLDTVVVFAFGNRVGTDGSLSPGPLNEQLAEATARALAQHPVPAYVQWEIADLLPPSDDVVSIGAVTDADGSIVYLSTVGVAEQVVEHAESTGRPLGRVGVLAFADHAVRCLLTCRAAGIDAIGVPEGIALPCDYDTDSGQSWTRNRLDYLSIDLSVRPPLLRTS